jgi:DNA-binding MarR family transcriptional regulator
MESKPDWRLLGFVLASNRTSIILWLSHQMATPKHLTKATGLRIGHVSNVLKSLANRHLVECVNPEAKRGRIYRLTPLGMQISEQMKKLGLDKRT